MTDLESGKPPKVYLLPMTGISPQAAIDATLTEFYDSINARDYAEAFDEFSPAAQQVAISPAAFAAGEATSEISYPQLSDLAVTGRSAQATVAFRSTQAAADGPRGDTCDNWDLVYRLSLTEGGWVIDRALPVDGSGHTACGGSG